MKKEEHYLSQRKHSKRRFRERFNISLNSSTYFNFIKAIHKEYKGEDIQCVYLGKESATRSVYLFTWNELKFIAIYHKATKEICTFLPYKNGDYTRWYIEDTNKSKEKFE
jgi:hypothetical protein